MRKRDAGYIGMTMLKIALPVERKRGRRKKRPIDVSGVRGMATDGLDRSGGEMLLISRTGRWKI